MQTELAKDRVVIEVQGKLSALLGHSGRRYLGANETDVAQMHGALLVSLSALGLAYVHLEATTNEKVVIVSAAPGPARW